VARAYYIYVIADSESVPIRAFTVKHEAITWISTITMYESYRIILFKGSVLSVNTSLYDWYRKETA